MKQALKVVTNQEIMELQNLVRRRLKKQGDGRIYATIIDVEGVRLVLNGKIKFIF
jgi:hypothetical protein